jgi:hypothetical protein
MIMALSDSQAAFGIGFMVAMTILGGIVVMISFVTFGLGWAVLSALMFAIVSIFVFVIALMYTKGSLKRSKLSKVPVKKSVIKSRILSIKETPFKIKRGKESDIVVKWKLGKLKKKKEEYIMKLWLDERTQSCNFSEEIKYDGNVIKLGPRSEKVISLKGEKKSIFAPAIWPTLTGRKDLDPKETRRLIWNVCEDSGWEMVRL